MSERFSLVQRVRFGDMDPLQHLNNVEFLRFFETARIDYIHKLTGRHPGKREQFGLIFAEAHIKYRAEAFFGDDIRTSVWVSEIRRSAFRVDFVMQIESDGRVAAEGYGWLVGYDHNEGRPQPLPDELREQLEPELRDPVG